MKNIVGGIVLAATVVVGGIVAAFIAALAMAPYALILLGCFAIAKYLGWL